MDTVRRGYNPKDEVEFGPAAREKLSAAAQEICYLLNRGYGIKSAAAFVGDHYLLSNRQRMALVRIAASDGALRERKRKELSRPPRRLWLDGFNVIITLEVALSGSLLLEGMDGAIRDLAGLRGSYRIVDKTVLAAELLIGWLDRFKVEEAVFYLDRQVSNSGRLRMLLMDTAKRRGAPVRAELCPGADGLLSHKCGVVTSDSIILDLCGGWYNLNREIIAAEMPKAWIFRLERSKPQYV